MERIIASPGFLLLATGGLLGLNFPLGRAAGAAGVHGLVWAVLIATAAALVLGGLVLRRPHPGNPAHLRYFLVTAILAFGLPNALLFSAIPHLGSGYTALFYTLSPMLTAGFAALAGLGRPKPAELLGIALGLAGAVLVVSGRGEIGRPAPLPWLAAGLLVPVSLAVGNVYRSVAWPRGADPLWLAAGSNAVAALVLALVTLATLGPGAFAPLAAVPRLALAQAAAGSLMFLLFFRLQRSGGPVTLSQIGTVAAGVGVAVGAGLLGERYPPEVWAGVAILALGLGLTVRARLRD